LRLERHPDEGCRNLDAMRHLDHRHRLDEVHLGDRRHLDHRHQQDEVHLVGSDPDDPCPAKVRMDYCQDELPDEECPCPDSMQKDCCPGEECLQPVKEDLVSERLPEHRPHLAFLQPAQLRPALQLCLASERQVHLRFRQLLLARPCLQTSLQPAS
jgi:hypothetical protein